MAIFTAIGTAAATAAFGAAAAGTIGFTFIATATAAVLQIAAGIAVSLIAKSMAGEPQAARFSVQGTIQSGDDIPRSINFGWNSTAGSKVYQNEHGDGGVYSTRVIALGDMPVRSLVGVEVYGVAVTLDTTPHASYGFPVLDYRKGGRDHLWIKFYDGTQTSADPFLVGTVSSADRPYDANRIARGIPYVVATSLAPEREDGEEKPLFQGFPTFKFSTYGVRLYDVSQDSSVGGSGAHRWDDPATWGGDGDFLPPVQVYNLLRGIRFNGQWVYGLQDVSAARLPAANWIAQVNKARASIAGPSGLEPQYRSGGEVQVGAPIHLAVEALLTSCQGRLVETGGSYKIYVGEPDAPVMSFTDGDIMSSEEQTFTPFFGLADTVNGIAATYPNPAESWNSKSAPSLLRPDLEIKDGNRRLMASVSLDMVPYSGQVQRLMRSALLEALRARRHTFVLGPEFRVLEAGDIIQWSSQRNGYEDKLFRVDGIIYKSNLDNIVDITEVDPSDYDWNQETDYRAVVDGPLSLVGPRPMPMSGWQVFPAVIDGRRPSIEVWAASGLSGVERVRVQVRIGSETGQLFFDSDAQPYGTPWKWILQGQFAPNTLCVVRGIYVGPPNAEWSGWLSVTTPDIKLTSLDIELDDLADEIEANVAELYQWANHNTRETIEEKRKAILLNVEGAVGDFNDRQKIRREVSSTYLTSKAQWSEDILTATGPGSAIVVRIEELRTEVFDPVTGLPATNEIVSLLSSEVTTQGGQIGGINGQITAINNSILSLTSSVGNVSASGLLRVYTAATPSGANARIALSVAATSGGAPVTAAMYLDAMTDGKSRIMMVADQISFTNGSALENPFVFESGVLTLRAQRVQEITAGVLRSSDSKFIIDLNNKRISIST